MINTNITINDAQGMSFGRHYLKKDLGQESPKIGYGLGTMVCWASMRTSLKFHKCY